MRIARFARLFGCAAHYFDGFIGNEDITRPREGCAGGAYVNGGVYVPEIESGAFSVNEGVPHPKKEKASRAFVERSETFGVSRHSLTQLRASREKRSGDRISPCRERNAPERIRKRGRLRTRDRKRGFLG